MQRNRIHRRNVSPSLALSTITLALLAACGGGGGSSNDPPVVVEPPPVAISGVVADGPLSGATVCYDSNDNGQCDAGEPTASAVTDANGSYSLNVPAALAGRHAVVAMVPATAVDKDTGQAIGAALTLRSPATGSAAAQSVFVSALTTLVADVVKDEAKSLAAATFQVQSALGLTVSPLSNFVGQPAAAEAAVAARAVTGVMVEAATLATAANAGAAKTAALVKQVANASLAVVAQALADAPQGTAAARAAAAAAAAKAAFNLSAQTVGALAELSAQVTATPDAPGPFISLRRFAYTDANNYSYTLFSGDASAVDSKGEFTSHEVRVNQVAGAEVPYLRNQMYWDGTAWTVCNVQWNVTTRNKDMGPQTRGSLYCGASPSVSTVNWQDIAGKPMRDVVAQIRAFPLADSTGTHTNADGLPANWGPAPELLPTSATFPAGAKMTWRRTRADIGGVDRIELTAKSNVRWPDGKYRQAVQLEQYSGMPGNLVDASVVPSNNNTVFVFDLPMASQPDTTLSAVRRYRAGFDVAAGKVRFYDCDLRKSDNAALNCATAGDGTLAISTLGDARLMRVASGYPSALRNHFKSERFWAEHSGTVFRGARDLENVRHDQRLNGPAWEALRTALNIPAHAAPTAPVAAGPFALLRNFTFTDAANYSYRILAGDSSVLDANGYFTVDEARRTVTAGALVPFARNNLLLVDGEWFQCNSEGTAVQRANSKAPFDSDYCKGYRYDRTSQVQLNLAGRLMSDVVNDIRAFGSKDGTFDYGNWGPNPSVHTALASATFPAGSTMDYRGTRTLATPWGVSTNPVDQIRVAPASFTSVPFNSWPFAADLEEFVAKWPGDLLGGPLNGATAITVGGYDLPTAPSPTYTTRVDYRVAFDANGRKARFYTANRLASTNNSVNYQPVLDTTYTVETVAGVRLLKFAAMPADFEPRLFFQRAFAERAGGVWYAFKDSVPAQPLYSVRLNHEATQGLKTTLGIQ
jgi:trimeric autotransporter adhesin